MNGGVNRCSPLSTPSIQSGTHALTQQLSHQDFSLTALNTYVHLSAVIQFHHVIHQCWLCSGLSSTSSCGRQLFQLGMFGRLTARERTGDAAREASLVGTMGVPPSLLVEPIGCKGGVVCDAFFQLLNADTTSFGTSGGLLRYPKNHDTLAYLA